MLQSLGSQSVGHDLAAEQQQQGHSLVIEFVYVRDLGLLLLGIEGGSELAPPPGVPAVSGSLPTCVVGKQEGEL